MGIMNKEMPVLVLASSSPRRSDLLSAYSIPFEISLPDAEELSDPSISPGDLVQRNAQIKARSVAVRMPDRIVLGADTIVAFEGCVFGKPKNWNEAEDMLEILNGKTHEVLSGVCVCHSESGRELLFIESTQVHFHNRSRAERRAYLERIHPLDKAGAYAAQTDNGMMIREISGLMSNVIGLPVESLLQKLDQFAATPKLTRV